MQKTESQSFWVAYSECYVNLRCFWDDPGGREWAQEAEIYPAQTP